MNEDLIIPVSPGNVVIPDWEKDDYLSSTLPFEWLYQFKDNSFLLRQLIERIKVKAGLVGVRNFVSLWKAYLESVKQSQGRILDNATDFGGQPFELHCGDYIADDDGITIVDKFGYETLVCPHPIMPVMRLVNIDSGEEKLKIAYKKSRSWRYMIVDKDTLASASGIISLAKYGIMVNSETAKHLVRYITTMESLNYDELDEINSVGRLGWIDGQGFSPYVDELEFDGNLSFSHIFDCVHPNGSYDIWLDTVKEIRKGGIIARILLAASFASVLVQPSNSLPFFVHVWGGTEAGKTVGLMLAASVWGAPGVGNFISTFNSTNVAQELLAGFMNSLPLCLDELQIQADRKDFDKTIYMLSEGVGKSRGAKAGGVQKLSTWRNCILTTGEMPISNGASGGGAVNRIVEIDCKDEKLFSNPREVVRKINSNYGYAGKEFVEMLQDEENLIHAIALQSEIYERLTKGESTEKQAMAASLILAADKLIDEWIFHDGQTLDIKDVEQYLSAKADVSQNERALDWLFDYIAQNDVKFTQNQFGEYTGEVWGCIDVDYIYIIKSVFDRIMRDNGFNATSFLSWAKQRNYIVTEAERTTVRKRLKGISSIPRCVCLKISAGTSEREVRENEQNKREYEELSMEDLPF